MLSYPHRGLIFDADSPVAQRWKISARLEAAHTLLKMIPQQRQLARQCPSAGGCCRSFHPILIGLYLEQARNVLIRHQQENAQQQRQPDKLHDRLRAGAERFALYFFQD